MITLLKYRSGEEIKKGDRILFHGNPAEIELVALDPYDSEHAWHVQEFGGGVLISDPMASGRTFIRRDSLAEYEDLEFVSRAANTDSETSALARTRVNECNRLLRQSWRLRQANPKALS